MSQALYRKWRPRQWDQVIGQEHVIQTLQNAVQNERVAHAYLFSGPRGTGKTTSARLLAKAVNCLAEDPAQRPCGECSHCKAVDAGSFLDLIEIDAASNTSVEDVRSLRDKINFSPNQGRYKVYIVDEVHMLSTAAFNALLKTLEEPPAHAIFVLATTEVHKIPATVLSRCQRHEFRRIPIADIVAHLQELAEKEDIQVEAEALQLVARQATGALRDAISLLDQLASSGEYIDLGLAHSLLGTAASQAVLDVISALIDRQAAEGLDHIHQALDAGSDPRQFARQIVDYLRDLLLIRMGNADQIDAAAELRAQMAQHAQAFALPDLLRLVRVFNTAANEARTAWQPALPLEMAFVEALGAPGRAEAGDPQHAPAPPPAPHGSPPPKSESPPKAQAASGQEQQAPPVDESGLTSGDRLFRTIKDRWKHLAQVAKQHNSSTSGLMNSCEPFGIRGNTLFIGFATEIVKSKMEKGDHLEILHRVIEEEVGVDLQFRCIVATGKRGELPPEVESDGMVAAALRDLGGEIVDIQ